MEDIIKNKLKDTDLRDNPELKNTIKLEDNEYNINAVIADVAKHTQANLNLEPSAGERTDLADSYKGLFDGNADKAIKYVPSDGGKFTGPVLIDNKYSDLKDVSDRAIVNYGQIRSKIVDLTGAPLFTLYDNYQIRSLTDANSTDYKLNTLVGTTQGLKTLKDILANPNGSKGIIYSYDTASGTYTVTGLAATDFDKDLIIPASYTDPNTKINAPVTKIINKAFSGRTDITSAILPSSITSIGNQAFMDCSSLVSVNIPDKVTTIGNSTFSGCTNLKNIKLGKGLTLIGDQHNTNANSSAFSRCTSLESIIIPEQVQTIGGLAFNGCNKLASVVMPKSIKYLGESVFNATTNPVALKIYYTGNSDDWGKINVNATNERLKAATVIYNHKISNDIPSTGALIDDLKVFKDNPLIYICKDTETASIPVSNKMFLKFPNSTDFVEISKGAARLESPTEATTQGYYTYETLAAIIAGINSRLAALGSTALTLPETLTTLNATVIPDLDVVPEELKKEILVDESVVPTVQDLEKAILKITTGELAGKDSYTSATTVQNYTDSLAKLREDLGELKTNIEYELNGGELGEAVDYVNSRIDKLEAADPADELAGKYVTKAVGGISRGALDNPLTLTALLKEMLGISDGIAPETESFSFSISPSSITANLGVKSHDVTATWSVTKGNSTYTGTFTPTIGGTAGAAAGYTGGTISGITVSFEDADTSKTVSGSVSYKAGTGFKAGSLSSSKTLTINRNCYYGPAVGTLASSARTTKNNWTVATSTALANDYFVIEYPKVWGKLSSIIDNDTQYEALGAVFSSTPTEVTKNGGTYYQYKTFNKQNSKMNFTIKK